MNIVGKFEKVSFNQFLEDYKNTFEGFDYSNPSVLKEVKKVYDNIKIPTRSTKGSAGYDFCSTMNFVLNPGETVKIPTGIRAKIEDNWVLMCYPRSSVGFKYGISMVNTIPVIDSDYYDNKNNEGHIFIKLKNCGEREFICNEGDKIVQGIFTPFGITEDDNTITERTGGIGSTGK